MIAGRRQFHALPAAIMLLAALLSYSGVPRMVALAPLRDGGLNAMLALDLNQHIRDSRLLGTLDPASEQARELSTRAAERAEILNTLCAGPCLLTALAPALPAPKLGYVAPRVVLPTDLAERLSEVALPPGVSTFTRPPPWAELPLLLSHSASSAARIMPLSRAPPAAAAR